MGAGGSPGLSPGYTVLRPPGWRMRALTGGDCGCTGTGPFLLCTCFSAGDSLALTSGRLACIALCISRGLWQTPRCWYIELTSSLRLRRLACSMWMKLLLQTQTYQVIIKSILFHGPVRQRLTLNFSARGCCYFNEEGTGDSPSCLPFPREKMGSVLCALGPYISLASSSFFLFSAMLALASGSCAVAPILLLPR